MQPSAFISSDVSVSHTHAGYATCCRCFEIKWFTFYQLRELLSLRYWFLLQLIDLQITTSFLFDIEGHIAKLTYYNRGAQNFALRRAKNLSVALYLNRFNCIIIIKKKIKFTSGMFSKFQCKNRTKSAKTQREIWNEDGIFPLFYGIIWHGEPNQRSSWAKLGPRALV